MDFELPADLVELLARLDDFIENTIKPLENSDDNIRFFDHRREDARTDWDRGGLPNEEWEQLLHKTKRLADEAGFYRYPFAERVRRDGRHQLRHGRHPRASGGERSGPAQRPAERALHRRQQRRPAAHARIRHRRAESRVGGRSGRGPQGLCLRHHRTRSRLRCHAHGNQRSAGRRRVGDQRREDLEHGHSQSQVRHGHGPDQRQGRRRRRHHGFPHAHGRQTG